VLAQGADQPSGDVAGGILLGYVAAVQTAGHQPHSVAARRGVEGAGALRANQQIVLPANGGMARAGNDLLANRCAFTLRQPLRRTLGDRLVTTQRDG
jgi:hypothetical protein